MTDHSDDWAPGDAPDLDAVMDTHEGVQPHRREHAKAAPRPDDDDLERRTNVEREEVGLRPENAT